MPLWHYSQKFKVEQAKCPCRYVDEKNVGHQWKEHKKEQNSDTCYMITLENVILKYTGVYQGLQGDVIA